MKKVTAFICAFAMCVSLCCIGASAGMIPHEDNTVRTDSGFCNDSSMITWCLTEEDIANFGVQGVLKIAPADDPAFSDEAHPEYRVMNDYTASEGFSNAPWFLLDKPIEKSRFVNILTVESGITQIGKYAFTGQSAMTTVNLYPTLATVKQGAFSGCDNLVLVNFGGTRAQWEAVVIEQDNEPLLSAEVHCTDDAPAYIPGDLDGDGTVTDQDAVYLLFHTFFADDYPVDQPIDYDGDGEITDQDAVYLLFYTFFPDDYPIQ